MEEVKPGPPIDEVWRSNNAELTTTGIVHNPQSAWAKEARRWEATHTQFGPPGRPYQYRRFPSWMYLAGAPEGGGPIGILKAELCETEAQCSRFEANGYRCEPLEAIAAYEAQQREFATLAAEREYEKRHGKMSPAARREVEAVEAAAGAQHLPTIAPRPGRKRGQAPVRTTARERAARSVER